MPEQDDDTFVGRVIEWFVDSCNLLGLFVVACIGGGSLACIFIADTVRGMIRELPYTGSWPIMAACGIHVGINAWIACRYMTSKLWRVFMSRWRGARWMLDAIYQPLFPVLVPAMAFPLGILHDHGIIGPWLLLAGVLFTTGAGAYKTESLSKETKWLMKYQDASVEDIKKWNEEAEELPHA